MRRAIGIAVVLPVIAAVMGLAGCGEKNQSLPATVKKTSTPAWNGARDEFVTPGWKPGDQTSWNQQMRVRAQTQNEYNKTN